VIFSHRDTAGARRQIEFGLNVATLAITAWLFGIESATFKTSGKNPQEAS